MFTSFSAIVIGTSAGGIDALSNLLPRIPANSKSAIFVVQHISPDAESSFIKLMDTKCKIKVKEACHTEEIQNGVVYFAPPDYHLLVEHDFTLSLSTDEKVNFSRPSIDMLFETAAEVFTTTLTGVLLTGANRDGAMGMKRIKDLGGKTIVQNPSNAAYPEMPSSVMKLINPDKILTLKEIGDFFETI